MLNKNRVDMLALSIIIVNYNAPEMLEKCLKSIALFLKSLNFEVIIVDNNSKYQFLDTLELQYSFLQIIKLQENIGFGRANNLGVSYAKSDTILLLNSDVELIDSSIINALNRFQKLSKPQLWGFGLIFPDGRFQNSFSRSPEFLDMICIYSSSFAARIIPFASQRNAYHRYNMVQYNQPTLVGVVYATAIMLSKSVFNELGGFSENYFMYFEDIDFCNRYRISFGDSIWYQPEVQLIHHVMGSSVTPKKSSHSFYIKSRNIYCKEYFRIFGYYAVIMVTLNIQFAQMCAKFLHELKKNAR